MLLPLAFGLACNPAVPDTPGEVPCVARSPQAEVDRCHMDEVLALGHDQVDAVVETARRIQDPVIRGAAVFGWIDANATRTAPEDAVKVCEVLEGPNRRICDRRQKSWHLQR